MEDKSTPPPPQDEPPAAPQAVRPAFMPQEMRDYPLPIGGDFRNMDYSRFEAVPAVFYPDRKMIPERELYVDSVWPLDTRTGR
jgi:hypothetical protein